MMTDNKTRRPRGDTWASREDTDPLTREYRDNERGKPRRVERKPFETLSLEGARAGLSRVTILHKRENRRAAFDDWDMAEIAAYGEDKIAGIARQTRNCPQSA
jgi:DNA-3-methyladenine glycosylase I